MHLCILTLVIMLRIWTYFMYLPSVRFYLYHILSFFLSGPSVFLWRIPFTFFGNLGFPSLEHSEGQMTKLKPCPLSVPWWTLDVHARGWGVVHVPWKRFLCVGRECVHWKHWTCVFKIKIHHTTPAMCPMCHAHLGRLFTVQVTNLVQKRVDSPDDFRMAVAVAILLAGLLLSISLLAKCPIIQCGQCEVWQTSNQKI